MLNNKHVLIPLVLMSALISCQSNQNYELSVDTEKYAAGKEVYEESCIACHQKMGNGVEGAFPPLANSDYLLADKKRALLIVKNGISGEMTVNGVVYNNIMPPQELTEQQMVDVTNYVLNAWGNNGGEVALSDLK